MKILIICSKRFYSYIPQIKSDLELQGNEVMLPNCYDAPGTEDEMRLLGAQAHQEFKARMFRASEKRIADADAVLVLNFDKSEKAAVYKNYIGGATFLEIYDAFRLGKKIYFYNPLPEGILYDELLGFGPCILNGHTELIGKI